MPILSQRQDQLTSILQAWNSLPSNIQKASINLVMPLIESASLFAKISPNQALETALETFKDNYNSIYQTDIAALGASDFSPDSMLLLEEIHDIDQLPEKSLEEKRRLVTRQLAENGLTVPEFRTKLLEELDHKYQHAHARVSLNYGKFADTILADRGGLQAQFSVLGTIEDEEKFFSQLVDLSKTIDIPGNFDLLKAQFGIDGIEEHTAINQGTLYRANLDNPALIHEIESTANGENLFSKAQEFFALQSQKKSIKTDTKTLGETLSVTDPEALKAWQDDYATSAKPNVTLTVGYEMEFLLLPFGGPAGAAQYSEEQSDFEKLVKGSADLDSRKNMRNNYGFPHGYLEEAPHVLLAHTPNVSLLFSKEELQERAARNAQTNPEKRAVVKSFLDGQKTGDTAHDELIDAAIGNIDLLSREEIFFLDLLFVHNEEAVANKLTLDGAFEFDKTIQENLANILPNIAHKASFYPQTLDMIRAHEVSIGPFEIDESIAKKNTAISYLRGVSAEHGLRAKDRDVQINIGAFQGNSAESLMTINAPDKQVHVTESTTKVLGAIQTGLQSAIQAQPAIARDGQKEVSVAVDRKKGFSGFLKETPFYKFFDEAFHSPDSSAFPVHRDNTGKSGMVRLARINDRLSVAEIRLIGNNTHVPNHDESVRLVSNGIEVLPEIILPYLIAEVKKLGDLSADKSTAVPVEHNGSIAKLPPVEIDYEQSRGKPNPFLRTLKEKFFGAPLAAGSQDKTPVISV